MRLLHQQQKFSLTLALFIIEIESMGYHCILGELLRTEHQQAEYYRKKLSKTMDSNYLKKIAIDIYIFKNGVLLSTFEKLNPFYNIWQSLHKNARCGCDWNNNGLKDGVFDAYHYEFNY